MKFRFVQENRETFRVGKMCEVLKVSRSGYYAWRRRCPSDREEEDRRLAVQIREIHEANRQVYGSPRIYKLLQGRGIRCGETSAPLTMVRGYDFHRPGGYLRNTG